MTTSTLQQILISLATGLPLTLSLATNAGAGAGAGAGEHTTLRDKSPD